MSVVFETGHGIRKAHDLGDACRKLTSGTDDVALAIIDLDFHGRGRSLLRILGACEPDFPILAVGDPDLLAKDEAISGIALASVAKPVDPVQLEENIAALCKERDMADGKGGPASAEEGAIPDEESLRCLVPSSWKEGRISLLAV